ncbi:hypothetical protein Q7A53_05170 [Halobacillus rhizosphaerae]|uniref:hypothetical protein n=1 Tax=Halobacillus rhizosphaerae TaxID=3064889 RepID=UPI00398A8805
MVFWTIIFLVFNVILITKIKSLQENLIKIVEHEIKDFEQGYVSEPPTDLLINSLKTLILIPLFIGQLVYVSFAVLVDPFLYPSIVLLVLMIISLLKTFIKKTNKIESKEDIMKVRKRVYKRKYRAYLNPTIWISYFIYMLIVLIVIL